MKKNTGMVTRKERNSYGLYFFGQNVFYVLVAMYMNTYFTDVGITAIAVAGLALVVKVWDAVNDPIFGCIVDKVQFKNGKFLPWLRFSLIGIPVATILMFAIPSSISMAAKIAWAVVAYILWDTAFTMCDVPIYGIVTTMTDDQQERTSLNALGRVCASTAGIIVIIIIPVFRNAIGGWTPTVILLSVIAAITMVPICLTARERVLDARQESQTDVGLKDMFHYVATNKYMLIFLSACMMNAALRTDTVLSMYVTRYCLGNETYTALLGLITLLPAIVIGMMIARICQKVDKFKIFYWATAAAVVANLTRWLVGYQNIVLFFVMTIVAAIPAGVYTVMQFMFTPDCAEYGTYKTGNSLSGITFASQSFFNKLGTALATAGGSLLLALIGFVEGEGAAQAVGFSDKLWNIFTLAPMVGSIIALIILSFYKLNDHDVQLMAMYNSGKITREEAESQMKNRY